jgi:hypothetical protein
MLGMKVANQTLSAQLRSKKHIEGLSIAAVAATLSIYRGLHLAAAHDRAVTAD